MSLENEGTDTDHEEDSFNGATVPYIAIYRASNPAPLESVSIDSGLGVKVTMTAGPIEFTYPTPLVGTGNRGSGIVLGLNEINLPPGSYVLIEAPLESLDEAQRQRVILGVAEAASLLTLRTPYLLSEKIYEGSLASADRAVLFRGGPMRLSVGPAVEASEVLDDLARDLSIAEGLADSQYQRFLLASRWYRRGYEAQNWVDKFLFWWTVVEVYPGEGHPKTVRRIRDVLAGELFTDRDAGDLKQLLRLGHIYELRKQIVHQGRAFAGISDGDFGDLLDRLQAIATVCLRLLAGLPPGDDLDKYLQNTE